MTLEEPNKIDIIGKEKDGKPFLAITDAGVTTDPEKRFALLVANFKTHVNYIISEEFKKEFPNVKPKDVTIKVICKNEPTEQMKQIKNIGPSGDTENRIKVTFEIIG